MASSKSNKKKKKQKRNLNSSNNKLEREGFKIISRPPGKEKMSVVFMEFVKPYMKLLPNSKGYNNLFSMAMTAWNMSFIPNEERDKLIQQYSLSISPSARSEFKMFVKMMIERKKQFYSKYNRKIMDFELIESEGKAQLNVTSTLD